jgi:hypothetical protein
MTDGTRARWWLAPAIGSALCAGGVALWVATWVINSENCAPFADANGRDLKFGHLAASLLANVVGLVVLGRWWSTARSPQGSSGRRSADIGWWLTLVLCLVVTLWALRAVVNDPYC